MRFVALVVLVFGCEDERPVMPDARPDAPRVDAILPPGQPDFFGEACSPPSTLGVVVNCRLDDPYPKAYCTPDGVCRPFCDHVSITGGGFRTCAGVGGKETQAFPTSPAHVCYCEPP